MKQIEQDKPVERTLRVPRSLYEEIKKSAEAHGLTVNGEIVERLHAASVKDQFSRLSREIADIKKLLKELLDKS